MPGCVALNCLNRSEKGFRLFHFPQGDRNKERRAAWEKNINRKDLPQFPFVCEEHFENDQFENNRLDEKRLLKHDAIPTIFNNNPKKPSEHLADYTDSCDEPEIVGDVRRSTRKRKPVKFEEYNSDEEESNIVNSNEENSQNEENDQDENDQNEEKVDTRLVELIRCRTCLSTELKEYSHIMKKLVYGKTVKQAILICTPELESSLLDTEYICQKCFKFVVNLINFIESCHDSEAKLRSGQISLDTVTIEETETIKCIDPVEPPVKRKRGRPRKAPKVEKDEEYMPEEKPVTIPKKRGRKRKEPLAETQEGDEEETLDPENFKNMGDTADETATAHTPVKEETQTVQETIVIEDLTEPHDPIISSNLENISSDHSYVPSPIKELLRCSYCQSSYRTLRGIKTHLTQVHGIQVEQNPECNMCKMKFIRYKDMLKHKSTHGHICPHCDKPFTTRAELEIHEKIHPEIYFCTKCGMKFKTEDILNKHMPLHLMMSKICKQIKSRSTECSLCDVKFQYESLLQKHIRTVHFKIKDYECNSCNRKCSSEQSLKNHMRMKHFSDTPSPFVCSECGVAYKRKDYLDKHNLIHSALNPLKNPNRKTYSRAFNSAEKVYHCQFCDTKFNSKEMLIEHLSVHADLRKFECKHCGLKLSCQRTKYVHERTHDGEQIPCSVCWKKFENEELLRKHEENHDTKKFSCNICNASFFRLIHLESHIFDTHMLKQVKSENGIGAEEKENPKLQDLSKTIKSEDLKSEEKYDTEQSPVEKVSGNSTKETIENDWDSESEEETQEKEQSEKQYQIAQQENNNSEERKYFSIDLIEETTQICNSIDIVELFSS